VPLNQQPVTYRVMIGSFQSVARLSAPFSGLNNESQQDKGRRRG